MKDEYQDLINEHNKIHKLKSQKVDKKKRQLKN